MTTTQEEQTYECTTWWCTEADCRGEHSARIADSVPATACLPRPSGHGGFWTPGVTLRIGWNTLDHQQPCVWLHIGGEEVDAQADLHLHEAKQLVESLQEAIATLERRRA